MLTLFTFLLACGPKEEKPKPPPVGWHQEETWTHGCYHPKKFEDMRKMERREERELVLEQLIAQWKGEKGGSISIEEQLISEVEDAILSDMAKLEQVSRENLSKCKQVATGKLSASEWKSWVIELSKTLTAGICKSNFFHTVLDHLELDIAWSPEEPLSICRGNQIKISGSESDKYRTSESGPWITILGDTEKSAVGSDLPCNTEGCYPGMLILKFVSVDGDEEIHPVGKSLEFTAPADGTISYGINDTTWFDNAWYVKDGLQHHASITVAPAK